MSYTYKGFQPRHYPGHVMRASDIVTSAGGKADFLEVRTKRCSPSYVYGSKTMDSVTVSYTTDKASADEWIPKQGLPFLTFQFPTKRSTCRNHGYHHGCRNRRSS